MSLRMVYAYSIDEDHNWNLIAKQDPRVSQNLERTLEGRSEISPGDKIAIRCAIVRSRKT